MLLTWLVKRVNWAFGLSPHSPGGPARRGCRPELEPLEQRWVPSAFVKGDVMVGISTVVQEHTPAGTLVQTLTPPGTSIATGSAFDKAGNFYTTTFNSSSGVVKFKKNGQLVGPVGSGYSGEPESISFDKAGNFYVGAADTNVILKFDAAGKPLASYTVATEDRGTDWTEVASDQHTLFYTSEGKSILRYDTATHTQLPDFNATPLPGSNAYAHRLLRTGGLLVADTDAVRRLDATGNVVQTYTPTDAHSLLFALNLDPDGKTFWTADIFSANVYRFNIQTGQQVAEFHAGQGFVDGLSVVGEITVGAGGRHGHGLDDNEDTGTPQTGGAAVTPSVPNTSKAATDGPTTATVHLPAGATPLNPTEPGQSAGSVKHAHNFKASVRPGLGSDSAWVGLGSFAPNFGLDVSAVGG